MLIKFTTGGPGGYGRSGGPWWSGGSGGYGGGGYQTNSSFYG